MISRSRWAWPISCSRPSTTVSPLAAVSAAASSESPAAQRQSPRGSCRVTTRPGALSRRRRCGRGAVRRNLARLVDQHDGGRPDEVGGASGPSASGPRRGRAVRRSARRRCAARFAVRRVAPRRLRRARAASAARVVAHFVEFLARHQRLHRIGALVVPVGVEAARQVLHDRPGGQHVEVDEVALARRCRSRRRPGCGRRSRASTLSAMKSLLCMRCWMRDASSSELKRRPRVEPRAPASGLNIRISMLGSKARRMHQRVAAGAVEVVQQDAHAHAAPRRIAHAAEQACRCWRRHGSRSTAGRASSARLRPARAGCRRRPARRRAA